MRVKKKSVAVEFPSYPLRLKKTEVKRLLGRLKGWRVVQGHHLFKVFAFKDFKQASKFVDKMCVVAERLAHHPYILLFWGRVEVTIRTHSQKGLTRNDFALAEKIDKIKP